MNVVHIDTHVAVWMYVEPERLRRAAAHLIGRRVALSPMALLELQYLSEIGRLPLPAADVFAALSAATALIIDDGPWAQVARVALSLTWTRDPFDRLIAAHAIVRGVPLVTADEHMHRHLSNAVWS